MLGPAATTDYGIVYVLTNSAMPGIVKIGMTTRNNVDERMKELFNTSVPVPFVCEYACKVQVNDCNKVEKALHIAFHPNRINPSREFFKISPEQAIAILKLLDQSDDITKEITAEINSEISPEDKVAQEKLAHSRRPVLNYKELGIPVGAILTFTGEENKVNVTIATDRKVLYNGNEMSLTAVTKELLGLGYAVQPTRYWMYEGKNLLDIYNDHHSADEME